MITRSTKLQLMVFFLVAVVGMAFTGARYANLGHLVGLSSPGYLVNADFSDSGGIFVGAQVTYRGVAVGTVDNLTLTQDGVSVALRLRSGTHIPSPARAVIGDRSAIGEQYVDLQPQSDAAPYLRGGDVIPQSMTALPIQPTQLVVNLDRLVRSVNLDDVTIVLDELSKAFEGSSADLQRLIDAGNSLTTTATQHLPQTLALIRDSKPVLDTQRDLSGAFKSYNANLAQLTTQLRSSDPDFRALFANGADAANTTTALLEANRTTLPVLLGNLVFIAQVQAVRIPALRQILVTFPNVVAGGFTVTPGDGTAHFGLATTQSPGVCPGTDKGYAGTKRRDPSDVTPRLSNFNAYCSLGRGQTVDVRGADNAPRAEGLAPFPNDGSGGGSATVQGSGLTAVPGWTTTLAGYDPATGQAVTGTGTTYTLDSTMGASQVIGAGSWQWLLLSALTRS